MREIPFNIRAKLGSAPEVLSYIDRLQATIDSLQKEVEWKDKVIDLMQRLEQEARKTAKDATIMNETAIMALHNATEKIKSLCADLQDMRNREGDGGWVPVEREVPASDEDVLFVLTGGDRPIKSGIRVENGRWWTGGEWYEANEVSHWRRLPEKPGGGECKDADL